MVLYETEEIDYLKEVFDLLYDEVVIIDANYNIIAVNNPFCEKYKTSQEKALGRKCYQIIHGEDHPCELATCDCIVEEVFKTGEINVKIHAHKIDNNIAIIEEKAYPIKLPNGNISHIIKIGRDITVEKEIYKKLKESDQKLNLILSNINDSIIVISKNFKILYMNEKAKEKYGTSLIGRICYKNLVNKRKPCKECSFNKLVANYNKNTRFEIEYRTPLSADKRYYELSCTPIIYYNGEPALIDIIRDVTDRKNNEILLKESEEKSRKLLENIPYSIILIDENKKIYDCNGVAEIYLNTQIENILNRDFFEVLPVSYKHVKSVNEIIHNAFNYDLMELKVLKIINETGNITWIEAFFSAVEIGTNKLIQIILHDITEQKYAEKIIKEESQRLRELDKVKKNLTVQTSEELKSPLEIMSDASQILLNSYKDKLDNNAIKLLEKIKNGGKKSINLVERIVDISKIETDKLDLKKQTESLFEVISDSIDGVSNFVEKYKIFLELDLCEDLYSNIDKIRITQVLKDLLLNLIKHTSKNGKISISLMEKDQYAEIILKNNGIEQFDIKNGYYSQEDYDELSQESIFGLYFSKEIIELHAGQINIETKESSKRTKVQIKLPLIKWADLLIEIYILYSSGIPLYNDTFIEKSGDFDPTLVSGSIIGILTILKEAFKGKKQMKIIDHGDRKLLFKRNKTEDVIFVLIVKDDLIVFHRKLNKLIEDFDTEFESTISKIESTCYDSQNWEKLGKLVQKYFLK